MICCAVPSCAVPCRAVPCCVVTSDAVLPVAAGRVGPGQARPGQTISPPQPLPSLPLPPWPCRAAAVGVVLLLWPTFVLLCILNTSWLATPKLSLTARRKSALCLLKCSRFCFTSPFGHCSLTSSPRPNDKWRKPRGGAPNSPPLEILYPPLPRSARLPWVPGTSVPQQWVGQELGRPPSRALF